MISDKLPLIPDTGTAATATKLHDVADRIDTAGQKAADTATTLIEKTRDGAASALDTLADQVETVRAESGSALHRAADQIESLHARGRAACHDTQVKMREQAGVKRDEAISYIRSEPFKSMLMAAAAGAALVGLIGVMSSRRRHTAG
ncbi:MAG: hypothetical protein RL654_2792 [Pseudomonadota bacterium]